MKHQSLGESLLPARGVGGFLLALVCAAALSGCADDNNTDPTPATVGSLNVSVNRESATVVVTGPNNFSQTFTGNQFLANLTPGQYAAVASADGFDDATGQVNVVAGFTSGINLLLQGTSVDSTVGSLNVNVNPASATVVVTGPDGY